MKKLSAVLGILFIAMFTGCVKDVTTETQIELQADKMFQKQTTDAYVPNQLIIKFSNSTTQNGRVSALAKIQGSVEEHIVTEAMKSSGDNSGVYLINTPLDVQAALRTMKNATQIEYAEPNWIYTYGVASNDTYFSSGQLWGMKGVNGSNAEAAWAAGNTGSEAVYVGIIDEGYMYAHDDLAANAGTNPGETAGNGKDDDGNGYVDDEYGWDFAGNNNSVFDGTSDDHGTHVAGTIGGVGGNGKGVAGVCWNVKLLSAKFLGARGGTTANAIKAVDYFTNLKKKGLNIVATNNSWGGGGFSQALKDAIDRAGAEDILFIAAAGNEGRNNDATASYPSGYSCSNIISVASITSTGILSSFSNYGANTVHIGAPGSSIISTIPSGKGKTVNSGYASYSGTSMATPHVTGAAALYKSVHTGATAAQIKNAILSSAVLTQSLSGKTTTGGRLDANAALSK